MNSWPWGLEKMGWVHMDLWCLKCQSVWVQCCAQRKPASSLECVSEEGHSDTAKSQGSVTTCSGVNLQCASPEKPARIPWNELKALKMGKNSMEWVKCPSLKWVIRGNATKVSLLEFKTPRCCISTFQTLQPLSSFRGLAAVAQSLPDPEAGKQLLGTQTLLGLPSAGTAFKLLPGQQRGHYKTGNKGKVPANSFYSSVFTWSDSIPIRRISMQYWLS